MKLYVLLLAMLTTSCSQKNITNLLDGRLVFSELESDYVIVDLNNFGCEAISHNNIEHVLLTGEAISPIDIHDHYSIIGCTIRGTVHTNGEVKNFSFDYGGIMYIEDELILGCGSLCCENEFENCTWEP